ncbi:MAG: hypothetical protein HONBIEJF_01977 [Fimbriimonadaceae bacterium]|nr:hypothetical protein [Fimbriimonadaceae bacterium]
MITMKNISRVGAAFALGAIVTSAFAQGGPPQGGPPHGGPPPGGPGRGMRGPMGGPAILHLKEVQAELKLSQDQMERIHEALQSLRPPQGDRPPVGDRPPQGNPPPRGEGNRHQGPPPGDMGQHVAKVNEALRGVMSQAQFKRYTELDLQASGPMAFHRDDVIKKLGLSENQLQQMHELMMAGRPGRPGEGAPPREGDHEQHRQKMMDQILGLLSSQQRQTWNGMVGKKFDFPKPPRR